MTIKLALYKAVVNRIPIIKQRYEWYVGCNREKHNKSRMRSWLFLIGLYVRYYILHDKELCVKDGRCAVIGSESALTKLPSAEELADRLCGYDVVSFDIFDTLIFRPFAAPEDLFYIVGEKLDYPDFRSIRAEAERRARQKNFSEKGNYEVDINGIYNMLEDMTGLDAETGIQIETETEEELCFPNPYIKKVYDRVVSSGKHIVITTDMYLNRKYMIRLLEKCGYSGYEKLYISCDEGYGKYDGGIWNKIREDHSQCRTFVHIGDNMSSDVRSAKKHGFSAVYYPNVNFSGRGHRPEMSFLVGSAYSGIVNSRFHCGDTVYSAGYEYGYMCGGLLVLGYCVFINKIAMRKKADKLIFFSRDGYILKKVYDKLYPDSNTEYVYWSRAAAVKLCAEKFRYDYLRRFIYHKNNCGISVKDIFSAMELDCAAFGVDGNAVLSDRNIKDILTALTENFDSVVNAYKENDTAAKRYFSEVFKDVKRAVAIDCGWTGSGYICLDYLLNEKWGFGVELFGALAGANGRFQGDSDHSELYRIKEKIFYYCFSSDFNGKIYEKHNAGMGHNIYFEMLMSAPQASFTGFSPDNGGYKLCFDKESENRKTFDTVNEIHKGIIDFADEYVRIFGNYIYMLNISGQDAYAPFELCLDKNDRYFKYVLGDCEFSPDVSGKKEKIQNL